MPRAQQEPSSVASRGIVVLGALLIAGLTVVAFAGGRLFGSAGDEPPADDRLAAPLATGIPVLNLGTPGVAPGIVAPVDGTPVLATAAMARAPVVCLDPGHGGPDTGFQRAANEWAPEMDEAVVVLLHAWDLEARLQLHGYDVVMTRRTDVAVNADGRDVNGDGKTARDDKPGSFTYRNLDELQARINVCNEARADLLVSMHVNGFPKADVRGYETWYTKEREFGDRNYDFAWMAYRHLKEQLAEIGYVLPEEIERGANPDSALERDDPHARYKHLIVLGPSVPGEVVASEMPGAIVEALFVSNDIDAAVLASPAGRDAIVSAYELAILEYFEKYPPAPR